MLQPDFEVKQAQGECNALYFKEITPDFSLFSKGGYGGANIKEKDIASTVIYITTPSGAVYKIDKAYRREQGQIKILSSDLNMDTLTTLDPESLATDCGCVKAIPCKNKGLGSFPDGCYTFFYEVNILSGGLVIPAGAKTVKQLFHCQTELYLKKTMVYFTLFDEDCSTDEEIFNMEAKLAEYAHAMGMYLSITSGYDQDTDCSVINFNLKRIAKKLKAIIGDCT